MHVLLRCNVRHVDFIWCVCVYMCSSFECVAGDISKPLVSLDYQNRYVLCVCVCLSLCHCICVCVCMTPTYVLSCIGGLFKQYPKFWILYEEYSTKYPDAIKLVVFVSLRLV